MLHLMLKSISTNPLENNLYPISVCRILLKSQILHCRRFADISYSYLLLILIFILCLLIFVTVRMLLQKVFSRSLWFTLSPSLFLDGVIRPWPHMTDTRLSWNQSRVKDPILRSLTKVKETAICKKRWLMAL